MSEKHLNDLTTRPAGTDGISVDHGRRKLSSAGIASTGVILSLASRSAMGAGWGSCTGSEIASGNTSRQGEKNPCGCSPGYWWNNNGSKTWDDFLAVSYPKSASFNTTFGVSYFANNSVTLLNCKGNTEYPRHANLTASLNNHMVVAFHAVAALLNAQFFRLRWSQVAPGQVDGAAVISQFQAAFNSGTGGAQKAALQAFKDKVDIYDSKGTWCMGSEHAVPS